jgi:hypothetical protein
MKKQIVGFILGTLFGGVIIFTIGADSQHPTAWDYKVVYDSMQYTAPGFCEDVIKKVATNGWEVVSAQVIPPTDPTALVGAHVYVVLKHPKQ